MEKTSSVGSGNASKPGLGAYLTPLAVIALSFGYAVGWGSFVMPGKVFLPVAGPAGTVIGMLIGAAAIVVFAFNYHRMLLRVPGPGGAVAFTTRAFGSDHGFLLAWFLWLTYVAILWANATALVLLVRYLFGDALQFGFHYTMAGFDVYFGEVAVCVLAIALCGAVCLYGKRMAAGLNTLLAGAFVAGVAAVFAAALCRHDGGMAAMGPAFSPEDGRFMQVVHILAMVPWAFVGFEAVVHSSAEFRFSIRRTFGLLVTAIAISTAVYLLLALLPTISLPDGYATWSAYIEALPGLKGIDAMPVFAASKKALGTTGVAVTGGAMLAAQLTGIFGTLIASSRLMHAMSEGGMIPSWLGRLNRDGTPANAILFVTCSSFAIPFLGRTVTGWPVDVSNLGATIAYGYTSAAVLVVAKNGGRVALAERITGIAGIAMATVFCLLMLVPNYISGDTLSAESYLVLSVWCLFGFLQYRHVFLVDWLSRFGHSIVVWIGVLVMIFFSSLMWIRLAICDASEAVFGDLVGKTVDAGMVKRMMMSIGNDMLLKMLVELLLLFSSLAIILNLFSILRRREKRLLQQKLEAEESAGKSRSYFFSTVSHDIRTPLNAIIGFSEMMKTGFKTDAEREQAVDSIIVSGKSLLNLVDHVLDFSRLESGSMEIMPTSTEVSKLVSDVVGSFRASNKNPSLELRCKADALPALMVDPQRVGQMLFDIVGNAVKFTKSGFVEVRATFATTGGDASHGTLRIEVEDTGCGIDEEDLRHIMSPYEQVNAKEARHGGTGLGLALCRQLAKAMGGDISVASTLGKGSTFTITLPGVRSCKESEKLRDESERRSADKTSSSHPTTCNSQLTALNSSNRRILVVDDQKMNLMVLKAMLKKLGYLDVATAADGKQALDALEAPDAPPFDIVLTDMWMPEMDGEGLVKAIRASTKLRALPVHVVTADVEMQSRYAEAGFDGILMKPATLELLKSILP